MNFNIYFMHTVKDSFIIYMVEIIYKLVGKKLKLIKLEYL